MHELLILNRTKKLQIVETCTTHNNLHFLMHILLRVNLSKKLEIVKFRVTFLSCNAWLQFQQHPR